MKLFNFLAPPELKASRALSSHIERLPTVSWTPQNYISFAREGYKLNVVAYQAIKKLADSVGSLRWAVHKPNGEKLDVHPMLDLINNPNQRQSGREFWRAKVSYLCLHGNNYDERVFGKSRRPAELWTLRPDRFTVIPGPSGIPKAYEYRHNGRIVRFDVNELTGDSDIRHTALFNPLDDHYGQAPIAPALRTIQEHNTAAEWLMRLLQNSARPSGALVLSAEQSLTDEQFARMRKEVEENYTGASNAGRPMLLEGGLDWKAMGFSPDDMSISEQRDASARYISLAFGVPPLLLNIPGDNTYSNYREARLGFYEDTVIPLADMAIEEINTWLSPSFDGHYLRPDYDSIEAIAEKRRATWEMVDQADELTVNEARDLKGFPPLPDPLGSMLMGDLRASRRGHTSDRSNNGGEALADETDYGA